MLKTSRPAALKLGLIRSNLAAWAAGWHASRAFARADRSSAPNALSRASENAGRWMLAMARSVAS